MTPDKIMCKDFTRKMRTVSTVILMLSIMLIGNPLYVACGSAGCVAIGSDLNMKLCVEYQVKQ